MFRLFPFFLFLLVRSVVAFDGDMTFYGSGGAGVGGACQMNVQGTTTVAINPYQYEGGGACGRCILINPSTAGSGGTPITESIFATIDNLCPECKSGDVDLGLGGDGRWQSSWEFVSCGRRRRRLRGSGLYE